MTAEFDGDHLSLGIADGDEDHAEAGDGSSGGAMIIAFFEAPEFFTGFGVVAVVGFGAATDESGLAIVSDDLGCGERLSVIAFVFGFAIFVEVLVVDGSVDLPDSFSGKFIESDDELGIAAVEVHDEQIFPEDGRGTSATVVIADEIGSLPEFCACFGVEASGARGAEGEIDSTVFDDGSWGGVAIKFVTELGGGDAEKDIIAEDFSGGFIEAEDAEGGAVFGGGGQPDLGAPDDWGRPGFAGDGGFPAEMFGFAKVKWEAGGVAVTVAVWAAELGPVFGGVERGGEEGESREDGEKRAAGEGEDGRHKEKGETWGSFPQGGGGGKSGHGSGENFLGRWRGSISGGAVGKKGVGEFRACREGLWGIERGGNNLIER